MTTRAQSIAKENVDKNRVCTVYVDAFNFPFIEIAIRRR